MTNITYDGIDIQTTNIIIRDIEHESIGHKEINLQRFSDTEGGKINNIGFDARTIKIAGTIKGTSKADLEANLDTLKKNLNKQEKNLDIVYSSGTRRYKATCSKMKFERNYYTIDAISFEAEFLVNDPPFGIGLDTNTLEDLSNTSSSATTTTMENVGYADFVGTMRPFPKVKLTITACNGIRHLVFSNTNDDGYYTRTVIENQKFEDGDVVIIDTKKGVVTLNGTEIEYRDGMPKFSLTNNRYNLEVIGISYTIDIKIIYYDYWL